MEKIESAIALLEKIPHDTYKIEQQTESVTESFRRLPPATRLYFDMSVCRYASVLFFTALSTKLLIFKYYGNHNKKIKAIIALGLYAVAESVPTVAALAPVFFDAEYLKDEVKDKKL